MISDDSGAHDHVLRRSDGLERSSRGPEVMDARGITSFYSIEISYSSTQTPTKRPCCAAGPRVEYNFRSVSRASWQRGSEH